MGVLHSVVNTFVNRVTVLMQTYANHFLRDTLNETGSVKRLTNLTTPYIIVFACNILA